MRSHAGHKGTTSRQMKINGTDQWGVHTSAIELQHAKEKPAKSSIQHWLLDEETWNHHAEIEQSQLHHAKTPRHLCRGSSTKKAMQRLRRCSQSEDSRSFHAAEEMQLSVIKHARQRHGEAANHVATQSKDQPKKTTVSLDPFHEETWKCSQSCSEGQCNHARQNNKTRTQ